MSIQISYFSLFSIILFTHLIGVINRFDFYLDIQIGPTKFDLRGFRNIPIINECTKGHSLLGS